MEIVSSGRSVSTNMPSAALIIGSRSGGAIDPDTSMSRTILRPPVSRGTAAAARAPISTSLCEGAHGQSPISVVNAIGRPSRGAG